MHAEKKLGANSPAMKTERRPPFVKQYRKIPHGNVYESECLDRNKMCV